MGRTATSRPARALTIAGSDSGGGAGIQADLKTFTAYGVYGMSVVTAVTAQNTIGVRAVATLDPEMVTAQIAAVVEDIGVDATKTGMLANVGIVRAVARAARSGTLGHLVVDPVMVSKHGHVLLDAAAQEVLRDELLPLADVVTPNLPETAALLACDVSELVDLGSRRNAAALLHALGPRHVVIKGGHVAEAGGPSAEAVDVWYDGSQFVELRAQKVHTRHTHGTGCTFSAAITACLSLGLPVPKALDSAKAFITWAIAHAPGLGAGSGPVNHLRAATQIAAPPWMPS